MEVVDEANQQGLILEPRAEKYEPEDPTAPKVGKWYWLSVTVAKTTGYTEVPKGSDEEPEPIIERRIEKHFACVVHLGSNYVRLQGLGERQPGGGGRREHPTWRIHNDDFYEKCEWIPNPEAIIARETASHQKTVVALMQEIREVTARLGVGTHLGLRGAQAPEAQSLGLVLAKGKPAEEYKTALTLAKKETLPELFEKIKEAHAEMALWMSAPLVPLEANADAMKPVVHAIEDRLFSVELYAGLCENVVQIRKGEPAKLQEPIRLFQRRAYMDEECIAHYEAGGMEFKDLHAFDKWMCKPAQMERLLPFPRCVLAMQVRRNTKDREMNLSNYFDILEKIKLDKMTFLYIRNGERMYRLNTEIDFDERLFPDMTPEEPGLQRYAKRGGESRKGVRGWGIIGENELKAMRETYEKTLAEWKIKIRSVPEKDKWHHEHRRPSTDADGYEPFDHSNVYFDDIAAAIHESLVRHNRLVLVLQGLLDRSEAFHPHPPWSLWRHDSFKMATELIYDDDRALTTGDAPDFEVFRKACNAQLKIGDVTLGQQYAWKAHEAAKHKHDRDWYQPPGNEGPGKFAHVVALKGKGESAQAVYQWTKKRRGHEYDREPDLRYPDVGVKLALPIDGHHGDYNIDKNRIFNVSGYKPGDFKQFFKDPRTRADYLQWAPILLEAEEFHAGNREIAPVKPLPPRKERTPGGSYEYRMYKARKAWEGRAVRLKKDIELRGGDVSKKGTLWRVRRAKKSGYMLMQINRDGSQLLTKIEGGARGHFMRDIPAYYFEPALEVPPEPTGKKAT